MSAARRPFAPPEGFRLLPGRLAREEQDALVAEILDAARAAPFYRARMPRTGAQLSVAMTNCGALGWFCDVTGYRYEPRHPETGAPWPPIPARLLALWDEVTGHPAPPECCLVNLYRGAARMGLHRDGDEEAREAPVLSVSLGDTALFRIGGPTRGSPSRQVRLASGDVVVLAGASRHAFHGVDRVLEGTSRLVPGGGRINLTLRRVRAP